MHCGIWRSLWILAINFYLTISLKICSHLLLADPTSSQTQSANDTSIMEANLSSTTAGDYSSAMDNAAELIGEKTIMMSLEGLSDVVDDSSNVLPSTEQTSQYLEKVALMRKQNAEMQQLNLLDEIIELTVKGKIGQSELETEIPDSIVFTIHEGDFMTEYIHSSITNKWATNCFQE